MVKKQTAKNKSRHKVNNVQEGGIPPAAGQPATSNQQPAKNRFTSARGGRKTAVAYARVFQNKSDVTVNNKNYKEYFKTPKEQLTAIAPFETIGSQGKMGASVKVVGGGIKAQAEAVRNAISRAIIKIDEAFKVPLRKAGFLTRDARMVERKKYGLKKARRAPQWSKR